MVRGGIHRGVMSKSLSQHSSEESSDSEPINFERKQVIQEASRSGKDFDQFYKKSINKGESLSGFSKCHFNSLVSGGSNCDQTLSSLPSFRATKGDSHSVVNFRQIENSPTSEETALKKADGFSNFQQVGMGSKEVKIGQSKYSKARYEDNEVEITGLDTQPSYIENWTDIPLHKTILKNIDDYIRPRKFQSYVIPLVLEGCNFKAQSETGSGKSVSFLVPIISEIAKENDEVLRLKLENNCPRAIIVAPTLELVLKLTEQATKIAEDTKVQVKFCHEEYDLRLNSYEIYAGIDVLVATPGRLIHFMKNSIVGISRLKYLVFDEADKLLDESFIEDFDQMVKILSKNELQVMLFSATFSESSVGWLKCLLKSKHVVIKSVRANEPNLRIKQSFEECSASEKSMRLLDYCQHLISEYQKEKGSDKLFPKILAFVRDCNIADAYSFYVDYNGISTLSLNSKQDQKSHEKVLQMLQKKKITMIITTDICSRGLNIDDLDYVINVDMPKDFSTYVQRIGCLQHGSSYSFIDIMNDQSIIPELISYLKVEGQTVPNFMMEDQKSVSSSNSQPVEQKYISFD